MTIGTRISLACGALVGLTIILCTVSLLSASDELCCKRSRCQLVAKRSFDSCGWTV